jgi:hypothetical protein
MLDAGTYRAHAIEAALGETDSGKEQIAVRFKLLDVEGQEITWYGYFTEKSTEITLKALRTAGWKGSDLMDLSDLCAPDSTPEVYIVVEHETYEGKTSAKVKWVNGAGGLALKKALDPNKAKTFAARMRGQIAAFDRSAGTPKPAPARQQPDDDGPPMDHLESQAGGAPGLSDDEIPF